MLVVFCVHIYSFAGSIRRTPPPTFSDPAITDRHSDPAIFQLRAGGADILVYWIGKIVRTCVADGSQTLDFRYERRTPYPLGQTLLHVRETGDTVRHRVTVRRQQIRDIRTRMLFSYLYDRACSISGAGKFCLTHGLEQPKRDI